MRILHEIDTSESVHAKHVPYVWVVNDQTGLTVWVYVYVGIGLRNLDALVLLTLCTPGGLKFSDSMQITVGEVIISVGFG